MAKKVVPTEFPKQENELNFEFIGKYIKAKRTHSNLTMHQVQKNF